MKSEDEDACVFVVDPASCRVIRFGSPADPEATGVSEKS